MGERIVIDPITRLEGHGKVEIQLDDSGNVSNAALQIPEFRGFERFCQGRLGEDMPNITNRICGVCPEAHHFASVKALDHAFQAEVPAAALRLREMLYNAYIFADHTLHFYYLGGPDFIVGPDAPKAERNILGVIGKVGVEVGKEVIKHRRIGQEIIKTIGGRPIHPVSAVAGGMTKPLSEKEVMDIREKVKTCVGFAQFSLEQFGEIVLKNKDYMDIVLDPVNSMETYYGGLVDDDGALQFYDGKARFVDPEGKEFGVWDNTQVMDHIEEHVEPWTYVKFAYLKDVGWNGLTSGMDSGVYRVGPLGRINSCKKMATPLAEEQRKVMFETLGGGPIHATYGYHWARLVELLQAAEQVQEIAQDDLLMSEDTLGPVKTPGRGVGMIEAARGLLFHDYTLDENAVMQKANMIVATTNSAAAISMSVRDAAKWAIKDGVVDDTKLNLVEMAFRPYDPCFACATHAIGDGRSVDIEVRNADGTLKGVF